MQLLNGFPEFQEIRKGGYLTIRLKSSEELLLCCRIGTILHVITSDSIHTTRARKFLWCSQEKAKRLILMAQQGHVLSWQSRNESSNQFGGAVWCGEFAVSFSGLPELADEALCLVLAVYFDWITLEQAKEYVSISSNPYFAPLWKVWVAANPK
ncbi:MAG: hypothetical protein ACNFW9_04850 [Candidatus Kerfeldbacteria bacterium]